MDFKVKETSRIIPKVKFLKIESVNFGYFNAVVNKNPLKSNDSEGFVYLGRDLNPYVLTDTGF